MSVRLSAQSHRRATRSTLRGETSRRVIATLISTGMVLQPIAASAGPTGGTVVGGNATITSSGNTTTIEQIDPRVVIDWDSFDIDAADTVTFDQPDTGAVALNRVMNDLPTNIRGQLLANGHVWIVNRNGVTFHAGSIVNVGSLLATTADISNADFLAGRNEFTIPGKAGATVVNNGSITFGNAGLAGLVAPGAENNGQIAGKLGTVIVAGERTFAIDFAGDGMFAFEPKGAADFRGKATNTGGISNAGGYILIAARTASGMVDESVSLGGVVEATSAEMKNGRIVLSGGDGLVNVAGTLDASGSGSATGGSVKVSGGGVDVRETARIDASGAQGGGTIEIGGGYKGASMGTGLRNADHTRVQQGATLAADGGTTGDGGTVVVWAEGSTGYAGAISARGGTLSGDGGTVEVSGKQTLGFYGQVDTSAANGATGTLLLDPRDIIVGTDGSDNGELPIILEGDGNNNSTFEISATAVSGATASVTLEARRDIFFEESVSATQDITATAGRDIEVNATLETSGNLTLTADSDNNTPPGQNGRAGTVVFGANGEVSGVDVALKGGSAIDLGKVDATGTLDLTTTDGGLTQQLNTALTAGGITTMISAGDVTLARANDFSSTVNVDAGANAVSLRDVDGLELGDITSSGLIARASMGNLTDAGATMAGDGIDTNGATLTAVAGDVLLTAAANDFSNGATPAAVNANAADGANAVRLSDTNGIRLGNIDGNAVEVTVTGMSGTITQTATTTPDDAVNADGAAIFSAPDGVLLPNARNDFMVSVMATASAANGEIQLGDVNAITVTSAQAGTAMDRGNVTIAAGGNVSLGTIDSEDLNVTTTAGTITQTGTVNSEGTATLSATGDITLQDATNDFNLVDATASGDGSAVRLADESGITALVASAGSETDRGEVRIDAGAGISLGDIDAGALRVEAATGNITDRAAAGPGDGVDSTTARLVATTGNVLINSSESNFTEAVTADGATVTLIDRNRIILGNIDATTLTVEAENGDIAQNMAGVTATGTSSLTATGGIVLAAETNALTGAVTAEATNPDAAIEIDNTLALSVTRASAGTAESGMTPADRGTVTLSSDAGVDLGDIDAEDLNVTATTITQSGGAAAGEAVDASGTTTLSSTDGVTLANALNDFEADVEATATADNAAITLRDANALSVSKAGSTGDAGNVTLRAGTNLTLGDIDAAALDADADAGTISQDASAVAGEEVEAATADLTATAGITLNSAENDFTGAVTAVATDANAAITLADQDALTIERASAGDGTVAGTGNVTLTAETDVSLEDIDAATLAVTTATGAITDVDGATMAGDAVDAVDTDLRAGTGSITLDAAQTNLTGDVSAEADGNIVLRNRTDLTLDEIDTEGTLTAEARAGILEQTADGSVKADGAATLRGVSGIVLDNIANELDGAVDAATSLFTASINIVTANALNAADIDAGAPGNRGNVSLTAGGGVSLGAIDAADLTVDAGGEIDDNGVGTINAAGATSLTAEDALAVKQAITLDDPASLAGPISADGSTVEIDVTGGAELDMVSATTGLTVRTDGALTQATNGTITVEAGPTDLDATSIVLTEANDFSDSDALTADATAGDIEIEDRNGLRLGDTEATGAVTITAATDGGAETLEIEGGSAITAGDVLSLGTGGAGALTDEGTASITLTSGGAFALPTTDFDTAPLRIEADGTVSQTGPAQIERRLTVNTRGDAIRLSDAGNRLGPVFADTTVPADGTATPSAARLVEITSADGMTLGAVNASNLTLTTSEADADITQNGGAISASGRTRISATGDVTLDDALNDFVEVSGTAESLDIADANTIRLGIENTAPTPNEDLTATGDLSVTAGDNIVAITAISGGTVDLESTGGGNVRAVPGSTVTATAGALEMLSNGGVVGGSAGSTLTGETVDLEGGSIIASSVTATAGDVDLTANDTAVALTGTVTATDAVNVSAKDVSVNVGATVVAGTVAQFINVEGDDTKIGGTPIPGADTFDLTEADIALVNAPSIRVTSNDGDLTVADLALQPLTDLTLDSGTGATIFDGVQTLTGMLTVIADSIAQASGDVTVTGDTDLTVATTATLDAATNDFGGAVRGSAETITLVDEAGLSLGALDATTLNATATSGSITDVDGEAISAQTATLRAVGDDGMGTSVFGDVILDSDAADHDIGTLNAEGATITVVETGGLALGAITQNGNTGSLSVTSDGEITDTGPISVAGATTLASRGAGITIDEATGNFAGVVTIDSADAIDTTRGAVVFTDNDGALALGSVRAQSVTFTNNGVGGILTSGVQDVREAARYDTQGGDILLTNTGNRLGGTLRATTAESGVNAGVVTVNNSVALELGDVDALALNATTSGGAGSTITQVGGAAIGDSIDVATATLTTDGAAITLTDDLNDFDSVQATTGAPRAAVSLTDRDEIILGTTSASTLAVTTKNGGSISDTGVVDVTGLTDLEAEGGGNIVIDASAVLQGRVDATGAQVTLANTVDLELGDISATTLTASADSGAGDPAESISQSVGATVIAGAADLSTDGGTITVANAGNEIGTARAVTTRQGADAAAVSISDSEGNLDLVEVEAAALTVRGAGSITNSGALTATDADIRTGGDGSITLNTAVSFDSLIADAPGGSIAVTDTDALTVTRATADGAISLATTTDDLTISGPVTSETGAVALSALAMLPALGDIVVSSGQTVSAGTDLTLATNGVLRNDPATPGDVTLVAGTAPGATSSAVELPETDIAGNLIITTTGNVTQTGLVDVSDTLDVTTTNGNVVLLDDNRIGTLVADAGATGDVSVKDADALTLGEITANLLTIETAGDLTGTSVVTANGVDLTATGDSDIALTGDNRITGAVDAEAIDNAVTINNVRTLTLGNIDAASLRATTDGDAIIQTAGGVAGDAIDVASVDLETEGGAVALTNGLNEIGTLSANTDDGTGVFGTLSVADSSELNLGTIISQTLDVEAQGAVTSTAGLAVNRRTDINSNGAPISLTGPNSLGGRVNLDGSDVTVNADGGLILGTVDADDLTVSASGEIRQVDRAIVSGLTTATTTDGPIRLSNAANELTTVSASASDAGGATDVVLRDSVGDLDLRDVSADTLRATAQGSITDSGAVAASSADLTAVGAGSSITLDGTVDPVSGVVTDSVTLGTLIAEALDGTITVTDADALTASGVTAGGAIALATQSGDLTLDGPVTSTGDAVALASAGDVVMDGDVTVTAADAIVVAPGGVFRDSAASDDTTLVTGAAFELPTSDFAGTLTIDADGAVTQSGVAAVDGLLDVNTSGAEVTLTAENALDTVTVDTTKDGADAAAVSLRDGDALTLDRIIASTLAVGTDGTLDDGEGQAAGLQVAGTTTLDAGTGDIDLDNPFHDFGGAVSADADGDITLADANFLTLGTVDGESAVTAEAAVDVVVDGQVDAEDEITLTADRNVRINGAVAANGDAITLTADNNDNGIGFIQVLGPNASLSASTATLSAADQVLVRETTTTGALTITRAGSVRFGSGTTSVGGPLNVTSDGDITDAGSTALSVGTRSTLTSTTGDVALDAETNDFVGTVTASGNQVTLRDANDLSLGVTTAEAGLDAKATDTLLAGNSITTSGPVSLRSDGDVVLGTGRSMTSVDGTVQVIADADGDGFGDVKARAGSSLVGDTVLVRGDSIRLATVTAENTATIDADENLSVREDVTSVNGDVDIDAGGSITLFENTTVSGDAVTVDAVGNVVARDGSILQGETVVVTGAMVQLATVITEVLSSALPSLEMAAPGAVRVISDGDITTSETSVLQGDTVTISGNNVTLNRVLSDQNIDVDAAAALTLKNDVTSLQGNIDLDAGTNVIVEPDATVRGTNGAIRLNAVEDVTSGLGSSLEGNSVTVSGADVSLAAVAAEQAADVDASGALTLTTDVTSAEADVDLDAGTNLIVAANATVSAANGAVSLAAAEDLTSRTGSSLAGDSVTVSGTDVSLALVNAEQDVDVDASGALTLNTDVTSAEGSVDLDAGATLVVAENAAVSGTNGAVTLTAVQGVTSRTGSSLAGDSVAVSGAGVSLALVSAEQNVDVDASGALTLNTDVTSAEGNIDLDAGTDLVVAADATVRGDNGAVTLTAAEDVIGRPRSSLEGETVSVSGGDVSLAMVTADQAVTVNSTGALTLNEDVTSTNGDVALGAGGIARVVPGATVSGDAVTVTADGRAVLAGTTARSLSVTAAGVVFGAGETALTETLQITSTGTVNDTPDAVLTVGGTTRVTANGQVVSLDNAGNDFQNTVRVSASSLEIADANDLSIAGSTVTGRLQAAAGTEDGDDLRVVNSRMGVGDLDAGGTLTASGLTVDRTLAADAGGALAVSESTAQTALLNGATTVTATNLVVAGLMDADAAGTLKVEGGSAGSADLNTDAALDVDRLTVAGALTGAAGTTVDVDQTKSGSASLTGATAVAARDLTSGAVTVTSGGGATVDRFSVASLDVAAENAIAVQRGEATESVTLRKADDAAAVDATVETVVTPLLSIASLDAVTLDRVGKAGAALTVRADDITVGGLRAETTTLAAADGSVRTIRPMAGTVIAVAQPDGSVLRPSTADISTGGVGLSVDDTLSVSAEDSDAVGNVTIDGDNAFGSIDVVGNIDGGLTVATSDDISVTSADGVTVGEVDVSSAGNVTLATDTSGDALATSTGGNAVVTGQIGGNADAVATMGEARIGDPVSRDTPDAQTTVAGNATATGATAVIVGTVGGDATATSGTGEARIGSENNDHSVTRVRGDAVADAEGGTDAAISAVVTGDATASAARQARLSGTVTGDATATAGRDVLLAAARPLNVSGALDATSGTRRTGDIADGGAVIVEGKTTLNARSGGSINLDNEKNDFDSDAGTAGDTDGSVDIVEAENVVLREANALEINTLDVDGDVDIATGGDLTLREQASDGTAQSDTFRIGAGQTWRLASGGDLFLNARIDGQRGEAYSGDLELEAGPTGQIRVKNLLGAYTPLGDLRTTGGQDLVFGLRTNDSVEDLEMLPTQSSSYLLGQNSRQDIVFVRTLRIDGITRQVLLLLPPGAEFNADFENQYFGLNIQQAGGFSYSGSERIDLFGSLGGVRSRASGLQPVGPRSGTSEFNNCLIGDPNSCSALTQANVLRFVDIAPDNVFVIDPDQVEQLFLSFGNEELWGLPSVFAIDIDDDDDEDDDDDDAAASEGTQ